MEIKPDVTKLFKRELYGLLFFTLIIILCFLIIHILVVLLSPDVDNQSFVYYVWSWVAGFLVLLWLCIPGLLYLWIINLAYRIEDERLVIQKGILTKKLVSIPYSAVTDFTLKRSVFERWLNIGAILVQTAGQASQAGTYEGKLEGLVNYGELHTSLTNKVKEYRGRKIEDISTTEVDKTGNELQVLTAILDELKQLNQKLKS